MAYMATQSPMDVENKAGAPDTLHSPSLHRGPDESFNEVVDLGEASWGFSDLSQPEIYLFTPTASSSQKPRFLSDAPCPPSPPSTLACLDLILQVGQADYEIAPVYEASSPDSDVSEQNLALYGDGNSQDAFSSFSHSPSPSLGVVPADIASFPSISDTQLLSIEGIEGIPLHPATRILSHSTPTSPTVTRQSGEAFEIFGSDMNTALVNQLSSHIAVDCHNIEVPRGRFATPRGNTRAQSTNGLSTQTSRTPVPGSSFAAVPTESTLANPNTAPMPPPREARSPNKQSVLCSQLVDMHDGVGCLGTGTSMPRTPSPQMPPLMDDHAWTLPELSPSFHSVVKQEELWEFQDGLIGSTASLESTLAAQNATIELSKLTDNFEHPGYDDPTHDATSGCLMPGLTIQPSTPRPRSQTTGMATPPSSSQVPYRRTSLPSTPAPCPARTPTAAAPRQITPMSSPLPMAHTVRGPSMSPSPGRGRLRAGEPGLGRSANTVRDSSVRKRRPSNKREVPHISDRGGFVNFTAQDSQALMMGVAPSGSSKTKAKREREEQERRRRLEQAAMKAIAAAGGNVNLLAQASLMNA